MDFSAARRHMVDCQLRTNRVTDERLIEIVSELPRERFVPAQYRSRSYLDDDVPLNAERSLTEAMVAIRLIQAAEVKPTDKVLVVGGATGYSACVLAKMAANVVALESDPALARFASSAITELGINNVVVVEGPLTKGCRQHGPYDAIIIDGAIEVLPQEIVDQLAEGGRLDAVLVVDGVGRAKFWRKTKSGLAERVLFDANVARLPGFSAAPAFKF